MTETNCAFCTGPVVRESGPRCNDCGVFHHYECWKEFGGCTTYGCVQSPDMKKFANKGGS
jgi:hypothetical protein